MRLWTLGSGSKGNATLLELGATRILVDAGFPARTLGDRLAAIGVAPETITLLVVTHSHDDHVSGAAVAHRRWGWPVIATAGTVATAPELVGVPVTTFAPGDQLPVPGGVLQTAPTIHDAPDSVAVALLDDVSGARAVVCTDLGHVTPEIRAFTEGADLLVLESNHDPVLLATGPYPPDVAARIGSNTGHLSNDQAATLLREVADEATRAIVLAHLSEKCNTPGHARRAASLALRATPFSGHLAIAPQHATLGPFAVDDSTAPGPTQRVPAPRSTARR